jgi:hypothetical protein
MTLVVSDYLKKERYFMALKSRFSGLLVLVFIISTGFTAGLAEAANPGEAGMLSLRMGVGAREAGMGESGVASSHGASALFWNPANNVFADFETDMVLQHSRYLGLFNHEYAGVAHKAAGGVLGFMFMGLYSDEIPRTDREGVGIIQGTYKPYDVSFGVSYARGFGNSLAIGVNAKMVYEKIDVYSDSGFAFDFFLTHRTMIEGLVFAASATNIGSQLNLNEEPFDLPAAYRVGMAYTPAMLANLTMTGEILFPNDSTEKAHAGLEYRLIQELHLRMGTRINYDSQGITAGAGFNLGRLSVDYAYEDMTTDGFDDGHKVSLQLTW